MTKAFHPPPPINDPQLQPPAGYRTWLEYAVTTFDARAAISHTIFDDTSSKSRNLVEAQVLAELNALLRHAGLPSYKSADIAEITSQLTNKVRKGAVPKS